ncbi:MAG TPA: hypothetical protein VK254_04980 [Candidatus Bathyarchaeia archaeon]|nr:hypothetical protein [Candidatus Bathyarchaeia archaeon]
MSNLVKPTIFGGIYARSLHTQNFTNGETKSFPRYQKIASHLEIWLEIAKKGWGKSKNLLVYIKNNLKKHISEKQEIYWPVSIAILLLLFTFASKIAFAEELGTPNYLPIEDNSKLNLIGFEKLPDQVEISLASVQAAQQVDALTLKEEIDPETADLKADVAKIVKNTPMAAMIDPISEKDRTVAAFIVGIAMKESKFGVYAPHVGGRDCFNYWGLKAGGKTTAGGYSCFSSPEEAVSVVGKTVEKMVAKGVHTPAQAISWKCGRSCAGHGAANVSKWISDVAVNFYKINNSKKDS